MRPVAGCGIQRCYSHLFVLSHVGFRVKEDCEFSLLEKQWF
ncbi:hypothetical protein HMPREF1988_01197 [Porphyromonas gingivalis F0185]|nr:hypothetical protein HMPREF1988_01197 [Porphyromonas gingivalis F0185]